VIPERVADDAIELQGAGREADHLVKEPALGAAFQVAEDMFFGFHVTGARAMSMSADQLHTNAKVRLSGRKQPGDATHQTLVLLYKVGIQGGVDWRLWDAVDA
jgi:hypothetical protein